MREDPLASAVPFVGELDMEIVRGREDLVLLRQRIFRVTWTVL